MLDIDTLHVSLGGQSILRGASFTAQPGAVTAICGANGAGKSTLLHAILGEVLCSGQVRLNGRDVRGQSAAQLARQRAVLAQDTQVAFSFTVEDVVSMGHEAGACAPDQTVVAQALAAVGLQGYGKRTLHSLSGGERQRAQLARALAQVWQPVGPEGPRWLFLDEPVAALDLGHQLQVMALVRRFAAAGGGVLMVMHDLNLTADTAHKIVFVVEGRIAASGPPDQVLTEPLLERAYGCRVRMNIAPAAGPWFVPQCCAPSGA